MRQEGLVGLSVEQTQDLTSISGVMQLGTDLGGPGQEQGGHLDLPSPMASFTLPNCLLPKNSPSLRNGSFGKSRLHISPSPATASHLKLPLLNLPLVKTFKLKKVFGNSLAVHGLQHELSLPRAQV